MTKNRAAIELVLAGALWGFGFVAAVWALEAFTPAETLVYRFIIASVIGEIIYLSVRGINFTTIHEDLIRALPAGALLGGMLFLQTVGLQYTTATKSGFLTSLYVILVPLINLILFRRGSHWKSYLFIALALMGTFILVDANLSDINVGDLWTLACSVIAALHIIYIGRVSRHVGNAFRFNNFQSFWCLLCLIPLLFFQESITFSTTNGKAWLGVLAMGLGSSIIAFYLQIRTQRILSDGTASMLFLLESPFAALFGFLLLSERLTPLQAGGAVLILVASTLQTLHDSGAKAKKAIT